MPSGLPAPLPSDVVLLHVGPHKTGTTTFQGAFVATRTTLRDHGVHYAGSRRQPWRAALAVTGHRGRPGDPVSTEAHWQSLVDEVSAHGQTHRVVVSSERFADADDAAAARIVNDLGGARVHVLITLRPLTKILPSAWQQAVRNGLVMPYGNWLRKMLTERGTARVSPTFWHRHAHDEFVQRWASAVGPERVHVLVLDEADREMFLRATEALLELPPGILVPQPSLANRSLTRGEVEVVRLLNEQFKRRRWPGQIYARYVRLGVIKHLLTREPTADEPAIVTPAWAQERAAEMGAAMAEKIAASGAQVIGDVSSLGRLPSTTAAADSAPSLVPPVAASAALTGTIAAAVRWQQRQEHLARVAAGPAGRPKHDRAPVGMVSSRDLIKVVVGRARRKVKRRLRSRLAR